MDGTNDVSNAQSHVANVEESVGHVFCAPAGFKDLHEKCSGLRQQAKLRCQVEHHRDAHACLSTLKKNSSLVARSYATKEGKIAQSAVFQLEGTDERTLVVGGMAFLIDETFSELGARCTLEIPFRVTQLRK
jgi:hypothetical protein